MNTVHDMSSEASVDGDIPRPVFSRFYARLCPRLEDEGLAELRAELLAGLTGDVVEIGAGNGQNFRHYPAGVRSVVAVEPEPHLRGLAVRAARAATLPVSVRAGRAESLPLPEASVDAAVLCLVMCSLPDRVAALAELRRVLRPGGVVRFLEHTRADTAGLALVQRIADATLWPWFTGGCKPPATPSPPCATPASPSPGCAGSGFPPDGQRSSPPAHTCSAQHRPKGDGDRRDLRRRGRPRDALDDAATACAKRRDIDSGRNDQPRALRPGPTGNNRRRNRLADPWPVATAESNTPRLAMRCVLRGPRERPARAPRPGRPTTSRTQR